jgi:hypothetical protein
MCHDIWQMRQLQTQTGRRVLVARIKEIFTDQGVA